MVENREDNIPKQEEEIPRLSTLVLDCDYLCHTVLYSAPALSHNGFRTEIVLGFLKRLIKFSSQFRPVNIVFSWDSKTSIRREVYPEYKENRSDKSKDLTEEEIENKKIAREQFSEIRDRILPDLGFSNVFLQDGYEADDIIASVTKGNEDHKFIIISSDRDLYQLITDKCYMYNPSSMKMRTPNSFKNEWNLDALLWSRVKSISGCSTDNVSGAEYKTKDGKTRRVGEKTAVKFLNGEISKETLTYKAINDAIENGVVERNKYLVELPMIGTNDYVIEENNLSRMNFVRMCERYGMKSMLNRITLLKWDDLLIGDLE